MNKPIFSGSGYAHGARRWRRQLTYSCALLLGCILTLLLTLPASAQSLITWEDLAAQSTVPTNPYEHLTMRQAYRLSNLYQLQQRLRDSQATPTRQQTEEIERLKRSLTIEGLDAEALLAQVNQAQAYSQAQSQATNASLENRAVKLSGYLLPLSENDAQQVTEFLLVPYVGACIHVPPPPPNQMVYVQPDLAIDDPGVFSPVFVEGKIRQQLGDYELFRVDGSRSVKASYVMTMKTITPDATAQFALPQFTGPWWQTLPAKISGTLTQALSQLQNQKTPQAFSFAMLLSFSYGVLHTLGPGHGKAVIISYFVGKSGSLQRGLSMGVQIAVFHVLSAIVVVVLTDAAVRQAGGSAAGNYRVVQLISYGAIALIGGWMLRQALHSIKVSRRLQAVQPPCATAAGNLLYPSLSQQIPEPEAPSATNAHLLNASCRCLTCDNSPTAAGWLALAVGAVPCSGALLVLLYGLANNLLWPSVAMAIAISVGMALTLSWIGMTAILGNRWGQQFAEKRFAKRPGTPSRLEHPLSLVTIGRLVGASCVCLLGIGLFCLTLTA